MKTVDKCRKDAALGDGFSDSMVTGIDGKDLARVDDDASRVLAFTTGLREEVCNERFDTSD